jgi:glycosyltransferase involved in cell wall biosynthesis
VGGPATFISALAPALLGAGHQVRVFTLWDRPPAERPAWLFGLSRGVWLPLRLALIFLRLLGHVRWAEAVYVNGLELPAVLAGRLLGRPVVLKIVGDHAWERARLQGATRLEIDAFQAAPLPFKLALQRRLRAFYCRLATAVVTPSRYLAGLVAGWGVEPERLKVIYNGLTPLPPGRPQARPALQGRVVLTAARLVDWKGLDHLLQALALLTQPARLIILGEGQERANLLALAHRLGLAGRVDLPGRMSRAEVLSAMAAADLFALASSYEGLPHVVLEALALGRPVVATAAGGTPEVVGDGTTGLLVPYGRPDLLAQALDQVLLDPGLAARLGAAGQARAAEFPWARTVAETTALIGEMIVH